MGGLFDRPSVLILLIILLVLLFGAKRLPDAARGLGRSLRIFKAETEGLRSDGNEAGTSTPPPAPAAITTAPVAPAQPVPVPADGPRYLVDPVTGERILAQPVQQPDKPQG
ncbi:MAG TPA: Sec-independent protein translocase subunit TatA [Candidatus Nanopelagicales bacterium]|jgi:sec-independent protein translocase protein TatA